MTHAHPTSPRAAGRITSPKPAGVGERHTSWRPRLLVRRRRRMLPSLTERMSVSSKPWMGGARPMCSNEEKPESSPVETRLAEISPAAKGWFMTRRESEPLRADAPAAVGVVDDRQSMLMSLPLALGVILLTT